MGVVQGPLYMKVIGWLAPQEALSISHSLAYCKKVQVIVVVISKQQKAHLEELRPVL